MPVVEYADAEDDFQVNIQPICGVGNNKRRCFRPIQVPCSVCLNYHPAIGSEASVRRRNFRLATPLHASQVPPQSEYVFKLLQRYPVMWQGLLSMKNDQAAVQMQFMFGNRCIARDSLPFHPAISTQPLRIVQRMRMEPVQIEGLAKKMEKQHEYCALFALPCGRDHMDVLIQAANLKIGFITYFQEKQAAGIINLASPGSQQVAFVVHIIPSCEFANKIMARIAPDFLHRIADIPHVLIVIATV